MYRDRHRSVLFTCLLGLCLLSAPSAAAASGRVQLDQATSRLASLARDLDQRDELQRWTFAVVTLDVLIDSYRDELEQSASDAARDSERRDKLSSWQAGTRALVNRLDALRTQIAEGAPLSLQVDAQQQLFIIVDGQPVAVSGPNPRADRDIARRIMQHYCAAYDCETHQADAPRQAMRPMRAPGAWSLRQSMRPTYETDNGRLRCVFGDLRERATKAHLCALLDEEIALLRDGLRQARQQGHVIDRPFLRQQTRSQAGRTILRLNPGGAYLEFDTPLLSSLASEGWQDLIEAIADPRDRMVTVDQADRLMVLKNQF